MYHTIEEFCKKIELINEKSNALRERKASREKFEIPLSDAELQFEIDDIRALCADIANDNGLEE